MKVTGHLMIKKGYGLVIAASQWIDSLRNDCEEHNQEHFGEGYLSKPKDRAVITVEFEVPDDFFDRPPDPPVTQGKVADC